jgi:hypothetical protein
MVPALTLLLRNNLSVEPIIIIAPPPQPITSFLWQHKIIMDPLLFKTVPKIKCFIEEVHEKSLSDMERPQSPQHMVRVELSLYMERPQSPHQMVTHELQVQSRPNTNTKTKHYVNQPSANFSPRGQIQQEMPSPGITANNYFIEALMQEEILMNSAEGVQIQFADRMENDKNRSNDQAKKTMTTRFQSGLRRSQRIRNREATRQDTFSQLKTRRGTTRTAKNKLFFFYLNGKNDAMKSDEALALFQVTGVEITDEIQSLIENTMAEEETNTRPATPVHMTVPVREMNGGIL